MKAVNQNKKLISQGFKWLAKTGEEEIKVRFVRIMKQSMVWIREAHKTRAKAVRHLAETDTMAWAVFHDGRRVAAGYSDGTDYDSAGNVIQDEYSVKGDLTAKFEVKGSSTKGWYGIVGSDMSHGWYRITWEKDFLQYSINEFKRNFNKYFNKLSDNFSLIGLKTD